MKNKQLLVIEVDRRDDSKVAVNDLQSCLLDFIDQAEDDYKPEGLIKKGIVTLRWKEYLFWYRLKYWWWSLLDRWS
jgi:hypothetical protein